VRTWTGSFLSDGFGSFALSRLLCLEMDDVKWTRGVSTNFSVIVSFCFECLVFEMVVWTSDVVTKDVAAIFTP
jgi:hypothetical protein